MTVIAEQPAGLLPDVLNGAANLVLTDSHQQDGALEATDVPIDEALTQSALRSAEIAAASFAAAKEALRYTLLCPGSAGMGSADEINTVRAHTGIAAAAIRTADVVGVTENPAHDAGRIHLNGAVAEATLPGGKPWRALGHVARGLSHMPAAHLEEQANANRRPVSRAHLLKAGALALSRLDPRKKTAAWREQTAVALTNYR